MGCICSKAKAASDKITNTAKSALGMSGSRAVAFGNPIKVFDCEKVAKGESQPKSGDNTFSCDDNNWSSTRCGCIVDQTAFVIYDDDLYKIDLNEKDYSKNCTKLDEGQKYRDTRCMCHYDGKLFLFSDTIYKVDVGLGMLSKLPSMPGSGDKPAAKTEAFAAEDGNWRDSRCCIANGKYVYVVCQSKLYRVDLSNSDAQKNTIVVNDESWGSAESMFIHEKKLYIVGSKVWQVDFENEASYPRCGWTTFDEQHSYWSPSSFVVGDYAYLAGYNGIYQLSMKSIPSGTQREVKHFDLDGRVVLNFI